MNKITIKKKYYFPRINDFFYQLKGARVFSKIYLRLVYHQERIKEEYISRRKFKTIYGHYEFMLVPFGLSNFPSIFMFLMIGVFREYLDNFVIVFLDDILIHSKSQEEHEKHLRMLL